MATSSLISETEPAHCIKFNEQSGHHSLHASRAYQRDEVIVLFSAGSTHSQATYLTIQLRDDCHISLQPSFLQYVNHSCVPNAFFDTGTMKFVALRDIKDGDELCFFYPSTEWQMAQAFNCHCGHDSCLGEIGGAVFLSQSAIDNYRLSEYIAAKLADGRIR